jgi:hypothetical protein
MRKLLPCSIVEKIWYHPPTADVTVAFSIFLTFASRFTSVQFDENCTENRKQFKFAFLKLPDKGHGLSKIKKTILKLSFSHLNTEDDKI